MLARNEQDYWFHERAPWLVEKPSTTFPSMGVQFTKLRRKTDWLRELPYAPVRYTLKHQADAWQKYFSGQGGRPKFKSKHGERSVTFPEPVCFTLTSTHIRLQKLGWYRLARRGGDPYAHCEARSVTVKRECGKWYAVVLYRVPVSEVTKLDDGKAVGVDMNVGQVSTSDGEIIRLDTTRLERLEARKRRYQRKLARQVKGSNRRAVTKQRLGKVNRNIRNFRDNWHHHTSKHIAAKASTVVVEKLNVKGMTASAKGDTENPGTNVPQKSGLNRSILNTGWAALFFMLGYKAGWLIEVNAAYTSQTCHQCGVVDRRSRITQAIFECVACGHRCNADINAALNILALGTGATGRGGGGVARPVKRQEMGESALADLAA